MQKLILSMLLAASWVVPVRAQEMTGEAAERAKSEVLKIEREKLGGLRQNGSTAADWFNRYNDDSMVLANPDGTIETKADHADRLRSKQVAIVSMKQYGRRVRVFAGGNVALVTYKETGQLVGQSHPVDGVTTDVWIKKDIGWQRILHSEHYILKHAGNQ